MHCKYTRDRTLEISSNPEENIHILIDEETNKCEITTSSIPSKGGCLQRCITFVKDWKWLLTAIRFVKEKCQTVVSNLLSLLG